MAELFKTPSGVEDFTSFVVGPDDYVTIRDIAEVYKGKNGYEILDEFDRSTSLASVLPIKIANSGDKNVQEYREAWKYNQSSSTTNIGSGPTFHKYGGYQKVEIMGMRDSAFAYRERDWKQNPVAFNKQRTENTRKTIHDMSLDNEHDMFYANPKHDPQTFLGIMPRYSVLTDQEGVILNGDHKGYMSNYITLDGGGTASGKLFSCLIIVPGVNDGVSWMVPSGTAYSAGINVDLGDKFIDSVVTETDQKGHVHSYMYDKFLMQGGISIADRRGCIRIANLDLSTNEGVNKFSFVIDQAFEALDPSMRGRAIVYYPSKCGALIRQAYRGLTSPVEVSEAMPKNLGLDFSLDGHNFKSVFHLTNAESKVV